MTEWNITAQGSFASDPSRRKPGPLTRVQVFMDAEAAAQVMGELDGTREGRALEQLRAEMNLVMHGPTL